MKIRRHIDNYNFIADQETGMTFRWGKTFDDNPTFAPVPELVDISISNHCSKGCGFCYRDSKPDNSFMSINDYKYVLNSLKHPKYGNVFQVALGGGEPLEHPDFLEIINLTKQFNIVPNFTTNGLLISDSLAKKIRGNIGAVAVSITNINNIADTNIKYLIDNNIRTNIHYVIDRENISQAISILNGEFNSKLVGINAVVFLTFKPSGRGHNELTVKPGNQLNKFVGLIDEHNCACSIGFDACFVPLLMHYTKTQKDVIDFCEVGFFSVYVDENLNVSPCSFSNGKDTYNIRDYKFYDIWLNKFSVFRSRINNLCNQICSGHGECKGRCQYYPEITICYKDEV